MLKWVTAVCIDAIPASGTRSSHVPGRSARVRIKMKKKNDRRSFRFMLVLICFVLFGSK